MVHKALLPHLGAEFCCLPMSAYLDLGCKTYSLSLGLT